MSRFRSRAHTLALTSITIPSAVNAVTEKNSVTAARFMSWNDARIKAQLRPGNGPAMNGTGLISLKIASATGWRRGSRLQRRGPFGRGPQPFPDLDLGDFQ